MENRQPSLAFDRERASAYDGQYAKLAPLRDAIHLLMRVILSDLPTDARVLCVGAGTGAELAYLAHEFPQWRFTVVEPAAPMLDLCRKRAEDYGVASRCTYHAGHLDSLPPSAPFHAATALLVSHFLVSPEAQQEFFAQIAARLRRDCVLVSSAIASDTSTDAYRSLLDIWLRMQEYTGTPAEAIAKMPASYGQDIAVLPPAVVASLIAAGGFDAPTLFYQALLIHAWYARKTP